MPSSVTESSHIGILTKKERKVRKAFRARLQSIKSEPPNSNVCDIILQGFQYLALRFSEYEYLSDVALDWIEATMEMKDRFQPELFAALMPRLTNYLAFIAFQDSKQLYFRRDFFRRWSQILRDVPPSVRENDVIQNISAMQDIAETILKTGHFVTQLCGLEVLLKYLGSCSDTDIVTKILTLEYLGPVREMLISFDNTNFDIDARHFLNEYNMRISKKKLVYSLFVFDGYIGDFNIKKPTSGDVQLDLWVDFNYYTKTLSFYFNSLTYSSEEDTYWVNVEMEIFDINIKRTENELVVLPSKIISIDPPTNFAKDLNNVRSFRFNYDEGDIEKLLQIINDFQFKNESKKYVSITPYTNKSGSCTIQNSSVVPGESNSDSNSVFSKRVKIIPSHENRKFMNLELKRISQKNSSQQTPIIKFVQPSNPAYKTSIESENVRSIQYSHNSMETTHDLIKPNKHHPKLKDITNNPNLNLSASISATLTNSQLLIKKSSIKEKVEKENKVVKRVVNTVLNTTKSIRTFAQKSKTNGKIATTKKLNVCHLLQPLKLNVVQNENQSNLIQKKDGPNFQEIIEEYVSNSGYVGIKNALKDQEQTSKLGNKELEFLKLNVQTLNNMIENTTKTFFKKERTSHVYSDIYDIRKFLANETNLKKKKPVKKCTVKKIVGEKRVMIKKLCTGNRNNLAIQKIEPIKKCRSTSLSIGPMKDKDNIEQIADENVLVNTNNKSVTSSSNKLSLEIQSKHSTQATIIKDINSSQNLNASQSIKSRPSIQYDRKVKLQELQNESFRSKRKSCDDSDIVQDDLNSLEANVCSQNSEMPSFTNNINLSHQALIHNLSPKLSAENSSRTSQNSIEDLRAVFYSPLSDVIHFSDDFSIEHDNQMDDKAPSLQTKSSTFTFEDEHINFAKNNITTENSNNSFYTRSFKKFRRDASTPNVSSVSNVTHSSSYDSLFVQSKSTASSSDISFDLENDADTGEFISHTNNFEENTYDVDLITDRLLNGNGIGTVINRANTILQNFEDERREDYTLLGIKKLIKLIKEIEEKHLRKSANLVENVEKLEEKLQAEIEHFCDISSFSISHLRQLYLKIDNLHEILRNDKKEMEPIFNNLLCDFENECKKIRSVQWEKYIKNFENSFTEHLKNLLNCNYCK